MKKLKVLNSDLTSPFMEFKYEIGKEYVCNDFDTNKDNICSNGFYATDIEGLPYSWNIKKRAFEVEVSGKSVIIDQYKQRFEKQTIVREVKKDELIKLAKAQEQRIGYLLSGALFPINPLLLDAPKVSDAEIELLKQWASVKASVRASVKASVRASVLDSVRASVRDSVGASVWNSVWSSVWGSIGDSVWGSIGDSVWAFVGTSVGASVGAYISSLFPNIKKWHYVDCEPGLNPFQPGIDLWRNGFVPSFNGKIWRLHSGKDAKTVYESTASGHKTKLL